MCLMILFDLIILIWSIISTLPAVDARREEIAKARELEVNIIID